MQDEVKKTSLSDRRAIDSCVSFANNRIDSGYNCVVASHYSNNLYGCFRDCGQSTNREECWVFYETSSCRTSKSGSFGTRDVCNYECILQYSSLIFDCVQDSDCGLGFACEPTSATCVALICNTDADIDCNQLVSLSEILNAISNVYGDISNHPLGRFTSANMGQIITAYYG